MIAGTPLTPAEQPYECLLVPQIFRQHTPWSEMDFSQAKDPAGLYCNHLMLEYRRVCLKSLRRQAMSEDDVHVLRLATALFKDGSWHPLTIMFPNLKTQFPPVETGKPLPFDLPFIRSSPLYSSSGWTDFTTLSATTSLRLEGIWSSLDFFARWQIQGENTLVRCSLEECKRRYWQDWFQVTSANALAEQGHGKPIFLNTTNWTDETYSWFSTLTTEYMRRAYHNQVDVYHVSQTGGTGFVDIFIDEWTYFGANPKSDPVAGFDCARREDDQYTPLRHARTDKLCIMRNPFASGDILQDEPRFISFLSNQASCYQVGILDRDGAVSIPMPGAPYNMGVLDLFFTNHNDYGTYSRQGGEMYFYSLIYEQILRALVANQGRFSQATDGSGTFDKVLVQYPLHYLAKDDLFVVKSVDKEHGSIHAAWIPHKRSNSYVTNTQSNPDFSGTPQGDFNLRITPQTRYEMRCDKSSHPCWDPTSDLAMSTLQKSGVVGGCIVWAVLTI